MRVAIAGGHGQLGQRLIRLLAERGDEVRSLDRKAEYGDELRELGAEPVVCDLESASIRQAASAVEGVGAVVFSAGAGPGSGMERKWTMDYAGAVKLMGGAMLVGARRYVIVSSIGADPRAEGDGFAVYLRAKGRADAELQQSGLDYTVLRPTRLTDDEGSGLVQVGAGVDRGEIPRDDVAAVVAEVLRAPNTVGMTIEVTAGDAPVEQAVTTL
ncbi:MAG TPA: SDR family oxidoreductase [Solirubrobacterales bacterium]|nr:SDR family oxidoreductase [Solirubrobacterales bacterium]